VRDYRSEGLLNETLLAVGVNPGEPPVEELVAAGTAARPLDQFLRKTITLASHLANAEDRALDGPRFWEEMAETLRGDSELPQLLTDGVKSGILRLTSTTALSNLSLFAVYNRNFAGMARAISFLRLLGLYAFAERRAADGDTHYLDPDSVAGGFAVSTSHRDRFVNVADRYLSFVEWSDSGAAGAGVDVRQLIEDGTGMSFENYIRCIAVLHAHFDPADVGVNGVPALERHGVDPTSPLLKWLDDRSYLPDEIDALLGDDPFTRLRDTGHFLALQRPFVRLGERYYLLNPRALDNALGLGVFYAAMDANVARAGEGNKAKNDAAKTFGAVAGRFYEQYAGTLVRRVAERSGSFFHPEVRDDENKLSSDFFVLEDDRLVFFEMRHGRVARETIESLAPDAVDAAFEMLYAKLQQLDRNVRKFADGRLIIPGIAAPGVSRLYPVVCLPSPFPRSPAIQRKIDADMATRGLLPDRIGRYLVAPFEIIEAESLEGLDGLQTDIRFSNLIDEKTADPLTRFTFFKNFLTVTKGLRLQMDFETQRRRLAELQAYKDDARHWIVG
jgi:hypothetical protein